MHFVCGTISYHYLEELAMSKKGELHYFLSDIETVLFMDDLDVLPDSRRSQVHLSLRLQLENVTFEFFLCCTVDESVIGGFYQFNTILGNRGPVMQRQKRDVLLKGLN